MTEEQREQLSYGCVGVTWVNSGPYPTNKLAFANFDENKYKNDLKTAGHDPTRRRRSSRDVSPRTVSTRGRVSSGRVRWRPS